MGTAYDRIMQTGQIITDSINRRNAILMTMLAEQKANDRMVAEQNRADARLAREYELRSGLAKEGFEFQKELEGIRSKGELARVDASRDSQLAVVNAYDKNAKKSSKRNRKQQEDERERLTQEAFDALFQAEEMKGDARVEMFQLEQENAKHLEAMALSQIQSSSAVQAALPKMSGKSLSEIKREVAGVKDQEKREAALMQIQAIEASVLELPASKALAGNLNALQKRLSSLEDYTTQLGKVSPKSFADMSRAQRERLNNLKSEGMLTPEEAARKFLSEQSANAGASPMNALPQGISPLTLPPVDPASTNNFSPYQIAAFDNARSADQELLTQKQLESGGINPMTMGFTPLTVQNPSRAANQVLLNVLGTDDPGVIEGAVQLFKASGGTDEEAQEVLKKAVGGDENSKAYAKLWIEQVQKHRQSQVWSFRGQPMNVRRRQMPTP